MTPKRIKELRKLLDGAAEGPWKAVGMKGFGPMRFVITEAKKHRDYQIVAILENPGSFDGDKFIAASRTALPEALDEIEKLRAKIEQLEGKKKAKKLVKKAKKNITKKKVVKKLKKKPARKKIKIVIDEPIRETNPKLPDYRKFEILFGKVDLARWRFKRIRANYDELTFTFNSIRRTNRLQVMYQQHQGVAYKSLSDFAIHLVDKTLLDDENQGTEGRFRGMPALIVDRIETDTGWSAERVLRRRIFFENVGKYCCITLQCEPDSFRKNMPELDEVMKAIWTS